MIKGMPAPTKWSRMTTNIAMGTGDGNNNEGRWIGMEDVGGDFAVPRLIIYLQALELNTDGN